MKLTKKIVAELLIYNPMTGLLTWRVRARKWFNSDSSHKRWNTRYANKLALNCLCRGHKFGSLLGELHMARSIIWLYMSGHWPKAVMSRNNKPGDNRWSNLVECNGSADARDHHRYREGRMARGVRQTPSGSWVARLGACYLGTFPDESSAMEQRRTAARKRWGQSDVRKAA